MSTKVKVATAFFVFAFTAWFYCTPYLTVREMKAAIDAKDAAKVASYVNFPAVRESVQASVQAMAERERGKTADALVDLGVAIVGMVVDQLVTPEGLAKVMRGEGSEAINDLARDLGVAAALTKSSWSGADVSMGYEGLGQFVVTMKVKGTMEEPIGFVFSRDGLFSWKLSALRLPM